MPVVTRSKRKSVDYYEIPKTTKRNVAKLRDITNRKNDSEGNSAKKVKLSVHKSDSALCVSRTSSFKDVKPSQSFLRLKPACSDVELASQQSIVSQASFGDALNAMKKVKKVIEDKLSSPAELLQLDIKPKCLYDIDFCHANHKASKIPQRASTEVSFLSQLYLTEERHFNFVHHIRRNLIANRIFPGTDILLSIFKEIMKFKSKETNFRTSFFLSELHSTFTTVVSTFPPCHIQESYLTMLKTPIQFEGIPDKKQILPNILNILSDLIHDSDVSLDNSIQIDFNKNFYQWDLEHNSISSFVNLSRNDKFNRIFMVLDLLTQLLEYDTTTFLTKHSQKFTSTIKMQTSPLICSIIWDDKYCELMTVNDNVKKIINIFISMVALEYPKLKIKIIAKLFNLIVNVVNLYEYPDNTTEYPLSGSYTSNLVNAIQKTVENSTYYSMDLWLNLIENLRSPLVRMSIASYLYTKIANRDVPVSLSVPFKAIYNRDFTKFDNPVKIFEDKTEKYPRVDRERKLLKCKISQRNFIKLLMLYADAVIKNFHLNDVINEIKNGDHPDDAVEDIEMKHQPQSFVCYENIDLNEKVSLRSVQMTPKSVHIRLTKDNCTFYRNEIKNLGMLVKLIRRCAEKYNGKFDEWVEMLPEV